MIRQGVKIPWRANRPPSRFHHGESFLNLPQDKQNFVDTEFPRLIGKGAFEPADPREIHHVSRLFLQPKPDPVKPYRIVADLKFVNSHCQVRTMKMETLRHLQNIAKPGDWFASFDLQDGFYAVSIAPEFRKYFTFLVNGKYYRMSAMP